jgi:hypothetical protein
MDKYIVVWKPVAKNGTQYYLSEKGTTFDRIKARVFENEKLAGMVAPKMCAIGYTGPFVEKD